MSDNPPGPEPRPDIMPSATLPAAPAPATPADQAAERAPPGATLAVEIVPATRSVLGAAFVVSAAVLLSRVLGLGRDMLTAGLFGASREMDAFFLAFTLPNLFRLLFGEGALSSALIPVLTRYKLASDTEATRRLLGTLATIIGAGLAMVSALMIGVAWLLPPGWFSDPGKFEAFRQHLTILLPYVVFICLAALQSGVLNSHNRFAVPALMPALANAIWIGALVGLWASGMTAEDPRRAVLWMSAFVLLTGIVQWAGQGPAMVALGLASRPRLALSEPGVKQVFAAMAPMLLALAVFQVNTFVDQLLAETLVEGDGAVSAYAYASRLFQFPLGLVGVALSTAMFPLMSSLAARGELEKLTGSLLSSLKLLAFIALPAAAGLAALAWPITTLLFGSRAYTPEMLDRTALCVLMFSISLPIVSANGLITKAFYALRDHRTPTRQALVAVVVNVVANLVLLQTPLREAGLALGTAISGALNLAVLSWLLSRRLRGTVLESLRAQTLPLASERIAQPYTPSRVRALPLSIARSALGSLVMALGALAVEASLRGAFGLAGRASLALSVPCAVGAGVVIYAGLSLVLKAPETAQILELRKRRGTGRPGG